MAALCFKNVGILGISCCVPSNTRKNIELLDLLGEEELNKVINSIGVNQIRYVDNKTTPSDLCIKAAEKLFNDLKIDKSDIDVLIFLTQNSDYKIPATSPSIQNKLGLSNSVACFDLNLACSGYIYALSTAFAYAAMPSINKVLLLVGETFTTLISDKDKVNYPLYGDAGTATIISKGNFGLSQFNLFSDGSGENAINIKAGGARIPTSYSTLEYKIQEKNNIRNEHQLFMDGLEVFNFTLKVVPKSISDALNDYNINKDEIDFFVFHQANKFMIDFFAKKLRISSDKVPISLDNFGNVSSATIPLTIVTRLKDKLTKKETKLLLAGFGAGLSWATVILEFDGSQLFLSDLIEY